MNNLKKPAILIVVLCIIILGYILFRSKGEEQTQTPNSSQNQQNQNITPEPPLPSPVPPPPPAPAGEEIAAPISNAKTRVKVKPFGIKVSPDDSPVSPEKFSGYHSGVDFEATEAEQNIDVEILAVCKGQLLSKRAAQGYGGVAVQECKMDGQRVTVIYGHLKLSSISTSVGTVLNPGDKLGVLGKGYSSETDNERKHLHLGIHKGAGTSILGYVQTQAALNDWIDITKKL